MYKVISFSLQRPNNMKEFYSITFRSSSEPLRSRDRQAKEIDHGMLCLDCTMHVIAFYVTERVQCLALVTRWVLNRIGSPITAKMCR